MGTETNRIIGLLQKWHAGTATESEQEALKAMLGNTPEEQEAALQAIYNASANSKDFFAPDTSERILGHILPAQQSFAEQEPVRQPSPVISLTSRKRIIAIAAAVLLLITGGFWYWKQQPATHEVRMVLQPYAPITPGGDKAVLTLADGSTVVLDSARDGMVTQQGSVKVINLGGRLAYDKARHTADKEAVITWNTLATPRGGQYMLILEDGSKVWLNAASSIKYPTVFGSQERVVELTGEAYLEVAKNPARPFRVKVNDMQVEVLGTSFNINAYKDEATINTTLLEGSVKIGTAAAPQAVLKPGQQAQLSSSGHLQIVEGVDVEEVVAWKNGVFQFRQADLEAVMRQIARWYDVDIRYEGDLPQRYFGGKISRNSSISEVIKVLQLSNIHVFATGRTITVTP